MTVGNIEALNVKFFFFFFFYCPALKCFKLTNRRLHMVGKCDASSDPQEPIHIFKETQTIICYCCPRLAWQRAMVLNQKQDIVCFL